MAGSFSRSAVNYNAGVRCSPLGLPGRRRYRPCRQPSYRPSVLFAAGDPRRPHRAGRAFAVDFHILTRAWSYSKCDGRWATFVMTILYGVEYGLITGMSLSIALHIYHTSRPHFAVLGLVPGHPAFPQHHPPQGDHQQQDHFAARRRKPVLRQRQLSRVSLANGLLPNIQAQNISYDDVRRSITSTCALETLETINRRLKEVALHLSEVKGPVMDAEEVELSRRAHGKYPPVPLRRRLFLSIPTSKSAPIRQAPARRREQRPIRSRS